MMLLDRPDAVSGENIIHLLEIRRAVHHHLLVQLDVDGHTRQHAVDKPRPVKTLQKQTLYIF